MGLDCFFEKVRREEVGYFRKVNFLVAFFEEKGFNVETQSDYYISEDDIEDLINRCKEVLDDHNLAPQLLPTMDGFFFGSTDYDEYYFEDVAEVLDCCENTLLPLLEENENIVFNTWY